MPSTLVIGGFFGDEGKGKIISYLALHDDPAIVVRGGAGPNAGHTIRQGDETFKVRMLPSGFLNKNARVMIGPGVVVDPDVLQKEIDDFGARGRAFIDRRCGIIEESHIARDSRGELKEKIGSLERRGNTGSADTGERVDSRFGIEQVHPARSRDRRRGVCTGLRRCAGGDLAVISACSCTILRGKNWR